MDKDGQIHSPLKQKLSLNFDKSNPQKRALWKRQANTERLKDQTPKRLNTDRVTSKHFNNPKIVQQVEQMTEEDFKIKYRDNPFFKIRVQQLLKDYQNTKKQLDKGSEFHFKQSKDYSLTLKYQRQQSTISGGQIYDRWVKWINQSNSISKQMDL